MVAIVLYLAVQRECLANEPLTLQDLRGKVVLVRWFMAPSCPFCSAIARPTGRIQRMVAW